MPEPLSPTELVHRLAEAPGWQIAGAQLTRTYRFDTYLAGADFALRAARIAEAMNHHPDILILWREVTLTISTHSAGAITRLDFEFARAVDSGAGD